MKTEYTQEELKTKERLQLYVDLRLSPAYNPRQELSDYVQSNSFFKSKKTKARAFECFLPASSYSNETK